jgi:hypothetical protein
MTTHIRDFKWSEREKMIARRAYDRAYEKECAGILNTLKEMIKGTSDPRDIWKMEDYLDKKRMEITAKYDYRYSVLILVFGRLMQDGLIEEKDLSGLDPDKIEKITGPPGEST